MAMLTLGPAKTAFALQSPTKVAASVNRICFIFIAPLSWDTTISTPSLTIHILGGLLSKSRALSPTRVSSDFS